MLQIEANTIKEGLTRVADAIRELATAVRKEPEARGHDSTGRYVLVSAVGNSAELSDDGPEITDKWLDTKLPRLNGPDHRSWDLHLFGAVSLEVWPGALAGHDGYDVRIVARGRSSTLASTRVTRKDELLPNLKRT